MAGKCRRPNDVLRNGRSSKLDLQEVQAATSDASGQTISGISGLKLSSVERPKGLGVRARESLPRRSWKFALPAMSAAQSAMQT